MDPYIQQFFTFIFHIHQYLSVSPFIFHLTFSLKHQFPFPFPPLQNSASTYPNPSQTSRNSNPISFLSSLHTYLGKEWRELGHYHAPSPHLFLHHILSLFTINYTKNTNELIIPTTINHSASLLKEPNSTFEYLSTHPNTSSTLQSLQRPNFHLHTICKPLLTFAPLFNFNQKKQKLSKLLNSITISLPNGFW